MKITNIMLSNRIGGIGQAYLDYNQALLERGHVVQAICHKDGGWREATEAQMCRYPNLAMLTVNEKGGPKVFPSMLKIRAATKNFQPDIIIIQNYVRVGMLATRGIAPQISITHMFKCKHFEKLNGVIALTAELAELCEGRGVPREKIRVIPNMISGPFSPPKPQLGKHPITIGGMGRLDQEKGFNYLLQAVAKLRTEGHAVKFRLGGKGFEEQKLRAQASDLGITECVEFLGFVSDKREFFETIDLFVIPSTEEPFGIVAIEAMKFGVPTIASEVGGLRSIFQHKQNGLLVEAGNPNLLAGAIIQLGTDHVFARRLAEQANIDVQTRYSMPVVGQQIEDALLQWSGARS